MQRRPLLLVCLCFLGLFAGGSRCAHAQATPTASKVGDLQVGIGYVRSDPDYSPHNFNGAAVYADLDIWRHFGVEADFHRISDSTIDLSENSYEVGGRYKYPIGPLSPYVKILVGRGTFTYQNSSQNGGYAMYAGGGGLDINVLRKVSVRFDYEYQRWGNFPPRGLQPSLATIGAAYRF